VACLWSIVAALASAWLQGTVYDERFHLEWSRRLMLTGETERTSHPNFDSKTPLVVANVAARRFARHTLDIRDPARLQLARRLPGVVWLAATLALVFLIGRATLGRDAASLATILVALDPNLVAHAGLAQVDVGYALGALATVGAAWALWLRPTVGRGLLLGAALAFAFTAKFTAVLLVPAALWPLVASVLGLRRPGSGTDGKRRLGATLLSLTVAAALFVVLIDATYGFRDVGQPVGSIEWQSAPMRVLAATASGVRLPLPSGFLSGIDICLLKERSKSIPVTVLGHLGNGPVWYYFLVGWLFKTPLLVVLAQILGLFGWLWNAGLRRNAFLGWLAFHLVLNGLYFSLLFRYQIGYRYVLMCLPWLALLAGAGLARQVPGRWLGVGAACVMLASWGEQAAYLHGDMLAFTNVLVQPKRLAYRVLGGDSNLDYGQNDDRVKAWLERQGHGDAPVDPVQLVPGTVVFNIDALAKPRHDWVRQHLTPVAHFRHTHLLFEVSPADFDRFLEAERRIHPVAEGACSARGHPEPPPGEPGASTFQPTGTDGVVCVSVPTRANLRLEALAGSLVLTAAGLDAPLPEYVGPHQTVWYRAAPGVHTFAYTRARGFRGEWHSTAGAVSSWEPGQAPDGSDPGPSR